MLASERRAIHMTRGRERAQLVLATSESSSKGQRRIAARQCQQTSEQRAGFAQFASQTVHRCSCSAERLAIGLADALTASLFGNKSGLVSAHGLVIQTCMQGDRLQIRGLIWSAVEVSRCATVQEICQRLRSVGIARLGASEELFSEHAVVVGVLHSLPIGSALRRAGPEGLANDLGKCRRH